MSYLTYFLDYIHCVRLQNKLLHIFYIIELPIDVLIIQLITRAIIANLIIITFVLE